MITNKDMIAVNIVRIIYNEAKSKLSDKIGIDEIIKKVSVILGQVRSESADQARKEAAERVACAWREHGEDITLRILRDAILGDSVVKENLITDYIPDVGEKLAIAVKALDLIQKRGTYNTINGRTLSGEMIDSKTIINEYGIIARDALMEIQ